MGSLKRGFGFCRLSSVRAVQRARSLSPDLARWLSKAIKRPPNKQPLQGCLFVSFCPPPRVALHGCAVSLTLGFVVGPRWSQLRHFGATSYRRSQPVVLGIHSKPPGSPLRTHWTMPVPNYREAVQQQSPGSRSAPWVEMQPAHEL